MVDLNEGYRLFVENYEKEKEYLDSLLEKEGVRVQTLSMEETVFELASPIAFPNTIIGIAFNADEEVKLYSTDSEYVVVHKKLVNGEFHIEDSNSFSIIGEAHYDYQLKAEGVEKDGGHEHNLVDNGYIKIPEYEAM